MGNKFCSVLTVVFLCTTIMLLEAVVKKWGFFYNDRMSWKEARLYCQTAHVDLIPLELLYAMRASRPNLGHKVWTGAVRQPEGARVWTEVSFKWVSCFKLLFVESNLKLLKFAFVLEPEASQTMTSHGESNGMTEKRILCVGSYWSLTKCGTAVFVPMKNLTTACLRMRFTILKRPKTGTKLQMIVRSVLDN